MGPPLHAWSGGAGVTTCENTDDTSLRQRHDPMGDYAWPHQRSKGPGAMQLVASVSLIVVGLIVAVVLDASAEMRLFGWVLFGVGVLGLVLRWVVARMREQRDAGPPR